MLRGCPPRIRRSLSSWTTDESQVVWIGAGSIITAGVVSTAFTDPATASGFLGTFGILGLIIMYLMANVALVVDYVKFRRGARLDLRRGKFRDGRSPADVAPP